METSREYAQALFMIACENHAGAGYLESLELVRDVFESNPAYVDFLTSVNISKKERTDAIDEAFKTQVPEFVLSFLKILCERERIRTYTECVNDFKALYDSSVKNVTARITSAVELDSAEKEKIVKKLEDMRGCTVQAEYLVDPSLIGGMIIETDGKVIDTSLKSRLCEVKEVIAREQ